LRPELGEIAVRVLKKVGVEVEIPPNQTCCGQPFINSGLPTTLPEQFNSIFKNYRYVVSLSSSCISTIKKVGVEVAPRCYELVQFLREVVGVKGIASPEGTPVPPEEVGLPPIALHNSCHSLRYLHEGSYSEKPGPYYNWVEEVTGLRFMTAERDECCGFGGVYSVKEGFLSYVMGKRKLEELLRTGAKIVTGVDLSCLLHLEGIARKEEIEVEFWHIVELLDRLLSPIPSSSPSRGVEN
jgi:L-lactate dehydrogenase complex protein LldE